MTDLSASQRAWKASKKTRGQYATERRIALIKVLTPDGQCAMCLGTFPHEVLEVDHVDGCTWNKRTMNAWMRVARYWREHESGIRLRALCRSCNGSDGQRFRGR